MTLLDIAKIELLFIFALFVPLILQLVALFVVSKLLWNFTHRQFGKGVWTAFALVGVPIHELSHAIAFILTGAGVQKMVLFAPKGLPEHNGATGVVVPKRKPSTLSLLVASIAPLFGCTLLAWLVLVLLLPQFVTTEAVPTIEIQDLNQVNLLQVIGDVLTGYVVSLFNTLLGINWLDWRTYLALYLVASLGMGAAPSAADFKYFFPALGIVLLFLYPVFGFLVITGDPAAALMAVQSLVGGLTLSISVAVNYATLFALVALILLWIISLFRNQTRRLVRR